MIYLKNILSILITDRNLYREANNLNTDFEIYNFLLKKGFDKEEIVEELEQYFAFDYYDLEKSTLPLYNEDNIDQAKEKNIIALKDKDNILLITNDILDNSFIEEVKKDLNLPKNLINKFAFNFEIKEFYKKHYNEKEKINKKQSFKNLLKSDNDHLEINDDNTVVGDFVDNLINYGIKIKASDIHIEPTEEGIQIRYRVDGDLVSKKTYIGEEDFLAKIISLIKVRSNLDLSERRKPQDGKITDYEYENELYEIRVSTIALVLGEKIVFRIAKKEMDFITFDDLGFNKETAEKTKKFLSRQNGIIFLGGATGSGKTTTLYTMIDFLNEDTKNIYTIEDPVEKKAKNINQIEIHEKGGITYPNTLRALLRQDPDVIVVGEIRDLETAELAANGSLTGHLMLSTVHANDAISTITRLLDMGMEPFLLGSTAIAFYSQRLVKTLCPHCKVKKTSFSEEEKLWFEKIEEKYNICYNLEELLENGIYEEKGCDLCFNGNKGRTAIVEYVEVNDEIKHSILQSENEKDILEKALKTGFNPFITEGIRKIKEGIVSLNTIINEEFI